MEAAARDIRCDEVASGHYTQRGAWCRCDGVKENRSETPGAAALAQGRAAGESLRVEVKRVGPVEVPLPRYQSEHAAGMDLQAALTEPVTLRPLERVTVPTGLAMAIPTGWEGQVRPRSGLAAKRGVTVINAPGTVDSDYRGEIKVALVNLGGDAATIEPLERIAQIVFARHGTATLEEVASLDETARGAGGYGSTGTR
ncbi:MAG: dUTP diphosphatase [Labilithrix sp.]|nr:dUTP diphosphatase [Labilithrix sp.]